jgi:hypothetical protein
MGDTAMDDHGTKDAGGSPPEADPPPRKVPIPRPPSQEDVDRVSEAQGLITDEWAGEAATPETPAKD